MCAGSQDSRWPRRGGVGVAAGDNPPTTAPSGGCPSSPACSRAEVRPSRTPPCPSHMRLAQLPQPSVRTCLPSRSPWACAPELGHILTVRPPSGRSQEPKIGTKAESEHGIEIGTIAFSPRGALLRAAVAHAPAPPRILPPAALARVHTLTNCPHMAGTRLALTAPRPGRAQGVARGQGPRGAEQPDCKHSREWAGEGGVVWWAGLVSWRTQAGRAVVWSRAGSVWSARGDREARSGLSHVHGGYQLRLPACKKRNGRIQSPFGTTSIFFNDFWWDLKLNTRSFELHKALVHT